MEEIHFTSRVLGPEATKKLKAKEVTQTLRGYSSSLVQAILTGKLKVGDQIKVTLNNELIGLAEFVIVDILYWAKLNQDDAERGGFDNLYELEKALRRAGYRFLPIQAYMFYRIQFSWLKEEI